MKQLKRIVGMALKSAGGADWRLRNTRKSRGHGHWAKGYIFRDCRGGFGRVCFLSCCNSFVIMTGGRVSTQSGELEIRAIMH